MHNIQLFILFTSLVSIILIGTVFFHYVEDWTWVDSYFFTVVTLSTGGIWQHRAGNRNREDSNDYSDLLGFGYFRPDDSKLCQLDDHPAC